jgi:hypothetical protein
VRINRRLVHIRVVARLKSVPAHILGLYIQSHLSGTYGRDCWSLETCCSCALRHSPPPNGTSGPGGGLEMGSVMQYK